MQLAGRISCCKWRDHKCCGASSGEQSACHNMCPSRNRQHWKLHVSCDSEPGLCWLLHDTTSPTLPAPSGGVFLQCCCWACTEPGPANSHFSLLKCGRKWPRYAFCKWTGHVNAFGILGTKVAKIKGLSAFYYKAYSQGCIAQLPIAAGWNLATQSWTKSAFSEPCFQCPFLYYEYAKRRKKSHTKRSKSAVGDGFSTLV